MKKPDAVSSSLTQRRPIETVYRDEHLEVLFHPGMTDYVVIAFAPMGASCDGKTFWGAGVAQKSNISMIGIMPSAANWYPASSMQMACGAIEGITSHYHHVVTYGPSMGGYAALKYSKWLKATHCLAFSPQYSINRADIEDKDPRFVHLFDPRLHRNMAIEAADLSGHCLAFFDPFLQRDTYHVRRIRQALSNVVEMPAVRMSHFPITLFAGADKTRRLFEMVLADDIDGIRAAIRTERRLSVHRKYSVCKAWLNRNPGQGRALFDKYIQEAGLALKPAELAAFFVSQGAAEVRMGSRVKACIAFEEALAIEPGHVEATSWRKKTANDLPDVI